MDGAPEFDQVARVDPVSFGTAALERVAGFELAALDAAASDAADVVVVDAGAVIALKMLAADAATAELSTTDDEPLTLLPEA